MARKEWADVGRDAIAERLANLEPAPLLAIPRHELIQVSRHGFIDGHWWAGVDLDAPSSYEQIKKLPKFIEIDDRLYGFASWNSDTHKAWYSTSYAQTVARAARRKR